MSKLTKALTAAAGNAGGDNLYVEDVFSTYLYEGTGGAITIDNGIDLAGEGGLVWIKGRSAAGYNHTLMDTERSGTLFSDTTQSASVYPSELSTYNSDGFTTSSSASYSNVNGTDYASWTFRKAEKFFDVVTYTGDGSGDRVISHSLNSTPASIIMKKTSAISDWPVYHTGAGTGAFEALALNQTSATGGVLNMVVGTSSSSFTVRSSFNDSGTTYVAYLFASDAGGFGDDGNESIIKCGSYTGTGSAGLEIDLGFEPQFLIVKKTNGVASWYMQDVMRGMQVSDYGGNLFANLSNAEAPNAWIYATATGFGFGDSSLNYNGSGDNYIYIAIRRPMKTPESGTEVFAIGQGDGDSDIPDYISNFPVDTAITKRTSAGNNGRMSSRLTGANYLSPNLTQAESADGAATFDFMNGWGSDGANRNTDEYAWMFKRATGFFDVVAYTGDGVAGRTVAHNLGAVPELMIVKRRSATQSWYVYNPNKRLQVLNSTVAEYDESITASYFGDTSSVIEPTSTQFTVGSAAGVNVAPQTYIAYLFATLAGVSKVGSYTGNGASQTIDCGFSGGARFILIKRTDSTGDWYVWDSVRGIVAGNDPHLSLNTTAAEVTTDDSIDPDSSGFIVNQVAATNINVSSASYIYLSIA